MNKFGIYFRPIGLASMMLVLGGNMLAQIDHTIDQSESNSGVDRDAQDRSFLKSALEDGLAEIQLGQLALQKSNNPQVKQFAQRMVDDHSQMNDHMKPIAQKLGVSVPSQLDKKNQKMLAKLSALSGAEFDQAYLKEIIKDHKQDVSSYHDEMSAGHDPGLRDGANQGVDIIKGHLQIAQQLAEAQNVK